MKFARVWVGVGVALSSVCCSAAQSQEIQDPAPPELQKLEELAPRKATANPLVTVHRTPSNLSEQAATSDWTSFLGPFGTGVSPETNLLKEWPANGPPLVWEMETGSGYSAPAVSGERLVYFHRVKDEEVVECLRAETGELYWRYHTPTDYRDSYGYGNGPRASPLIDDGKVYTYGVQGTLLCLELATGQLHWQRELSREFEVPQDFFGVVSTPLIDGEQLIVHLGAPGGPCVISLDKNTGAMLWGAGDQWAAGYAAPMIGEVHGNRRLFVFAGGKSRPPNGGLLCLDPTDGKVLFRFPWRSRTYESVNASNPVLIGNQVFVSATYNTGGALLNLNPENGYEVAWKSDVLGTHFNTSIHKDGYLYGFDGRNEPDASLVCQEVTTGKEMWRTVLEWEETFELNNVTKPRTIGVYRGSLLAADGDYLCLGERGHLLWLELTPEGFREIARAWPFAAHETWSTMVLSRGLLYVCQNSRDFITSKQPRLICFDLRRSSDQK